MTNFPDRINIALDALDPTLLSRSGAIFYSGQTAFLKPAPLYILGLNPGGDPEKQAADTVARHIEQFRTQHLRWSAYADESWQGNAPGTHGLQPRVLHMLRRLGLDPYSVPAANLVFARSRCEADLTIEKAELIRTCAPVHQAVLDALGVHTILCFGRTAGAWAREMLKTDRMIDSWREANNRRWTSRADLAVDGRTVITVTHPSRANWINPASDPTPFVERALTLRS